MDIEDLERRVRNIEKSLSGVVGIEAIGNLAIDLFLQKAHDLKKIDAKRDDVINCLCQKIAILEERLNKEIKNANSRR